jgi:hypothetical protein
VPIPFFNSKKQINKKWGPLYVLYKYCIRFDIFDFFEPVTKLKPVGGEGLGCMGEGVGEIVRTQRTVK